MNHDKNAFKLFVHGSVIFVSLGITIAHEVLTRMGIDGNSKYVFSFALLAVALMLGRRMHMQVMLLIGVILINAPEASQAFYGYDKDVMIATVCAGILLPTLYDLIMSV